MPHLSKKAALDVRTFPGDPRNPDKDKHPRLVHITLDSTGQYVAHDKRNGIIVQGATLEEAMTMQNKAINFLWRNCPEVHDELYPNHVPAETAMKAVGIEHFEFSQEITVSRKR